MLAIVLVVTGGALFYAMSSPDEYTGRALVQFRPRATKNGGVVGDATAASATSGYAAYLGAPSTLQSVAGQIGVQPSMLREGLAIQVIPATTTLSVSFTSGAADLSAQGANAMAQVAQLRATDDPLVSATVLAPAGIPGAPSGPQRTLIVVAGFLLGVLLAAATYFFAKALGRSRGPQKQAFSEPLPAQSAAPVARPSEQAAAPAESDHYEARSTVTASADRAAGA